MSDKPKRGFPAKYVLVKLLVLPEDKAYLDAVEAAQALLSRNEAGRLVIGHARARRLFLNGIDAKMETTP